MQPPHSSHTHTPTLPHSAAHLSAQRDAASLFRGPPAHTRCSPSMRVPHCRAADGPVEDVLLQRGRVAAAEPHFSVLVKL